MWASSAPLAASALLQPLRPLAAAAAPLQRAPLCSRWPLTRMTWARLARTAATAGSGVSESSSNNAADEAPMAFGDLLEEDDGAVPAIGDLEGWTGLASPDAIEQDRAAYAAGLRNSSQALEPALYVVSTPIGNLEDMTLRALRVLRFADAILAEDTRHTRTLLQRFGIRTPLVSYHAHNEKQRQRSVLERLRGGAALAVVSDAGTPGVSDPGSLLVAAAAESGIRIIPVPGPSALLAALVASGLPTTSVLFAGFLPPKSTARRRRLAALGAATATVVLYVPPHKLKSTLEEAAEVIGKERRCCVARELTKVHEEFWRGPLGGAADEFARSGRARGEVTLVIAGSPEGRGEGGSGGGGAGAEDAEDAEGREGGPGGAGGAGAGGGEASVEEQLRSLIAAGESPSHAAKVVAEKTGVRKRDVYAVALQIAEAAVGNVKKGAAAAVRGPSIMPQEPTRS